MSKRMSFALLGVLLLAGCNNNDQEPTVTLDEQHEIKKLHNDQARRPGTEDEIHYLVWDGVTVTDAANNPVRVVRVKYKIGTRPDMMDVLYRFDNGRPILTRLNGSGDHWHPEAQVWVKGKPQ